MVPVHTVDICVPLVASTCIVVSLSEANGRTCEAVLSRIEAHVRGVSPCTLERMPDNCDAEQCLFCTFAHLAHLHPQRLALLKPRTGGRWHVTEREAVPTTATNATEFKEQEEEKVGGDNCAADLKVKESLCIRQTPNNTHAIQEDEPLLPSASSFLQFVVRQNALCLSNKHHMYDGDETFTYWTLLTLANAVAMRLREVLTAAVISASTPGNAGGISSVRTVGIFIGASVEYVVAVLAVLQCGLAFVPLEPSWPARRIAMVVTDSEPLVLLTSKQTKNVFRDPLSSSNGLTVLCIDLEHLQPLDALSSLANCSCFCHTMGIRSYCYVMYTSGSSGKPKGVYGTEMGLFHRLQWMQKEYPFLEDDVAILKTSVAFVDHLTELLGPLLGGSLVVVPPREEFLRNPLGLLHFCQAYNISRLTAVPSLMSALLPTLLTNADSLSIKVLVLSGEALPYNLLKSLQACLPHATILNLYGCTELSGDCLCFDCSLLEETWNFFSVPIGKPLPGCIVQVLSEHAETGDEGELWVGGVLVALGYRNHTFCERDNFTAFVDPDAAYHNVRFFRTGDYVKRLKDGSLLFLGRKDRIVKVSGNKVSLDEVENSLGMHPLVAQSAVSVQKGVNSDSTIVAYVVLNQGPDCTVHELPETSQDLADVGGTQASVIVSSLRSWLIKRLPTAMVPGRFNFVRTLPFVSSGKVDYQALFNLHVKELAKTEFSDVDVSSLTNRIKRAFKLVLKLDYISIDDDFFSLGGTSISAAHLAHILAIDMRLLYTHSTIIELESALRALQKETEGSLAPNLDDGLPDSRSLKRVKKDLTPNATHSGVSSCCTEQSVSRESSSFRHAVENDSWPYAHMGDAPVAFLRCNACMPKEVCLSAHDLFLEPCSMKDLGTLGILWKSHLKACVDASPVLMCSQGVCLVFIGSHAHNFLCIDAYNGNVVWERQLGDRVESTAALTSDFKHVIVGSYDGYLYIFETGTGILKWRFQTKAEVKCQPTVDGRGLVWSGSHDHHIYALNVLEQSDWELDCKASIFAAAAHDSTRFLTYIATTAGTIMAFSTESSHPQVTWTHACGAPIFGSLAVDAASGYLICTLVNGKVLAFMPGGVIAWEYTCVGPVFAGATLTTALPSQVIVCSRDGWVYFLHLNSGKCLWKYCLGEPITSSAYVDESLNLVIKESDDDTMYSHNYRLVCACGSSGHVHVLKIYAGSTSSSCSSVVKDFSTRNDLSRIPFPDGNQSNGSMSGSKAGDKEGGASKTEYRDCLTVGGCEFVAVLKLPGDIFSSPVMLGGRIFVGCRDDYLYCLEISGLGLHKKEFTNLCSSTTTE